MYLVPTLPCTNGLLGDDDVAERAAVARHFNFFMYLIIYEVEAYKTNVIDKFQSYLSVMIPSTGGRTAFGSY